MNPSEREDLLARWFESDLTPDETRQLGALLEHPEAEARFRGLVGVEGLLRARFSPTRDDLADRVADSVLAERRRRLTSRVMETLRGRRRVRRGFGWLVAAAVVLVAVAAALIFRPQPTPGRVATAPEAQREAPPQAERIRDLPAAPIPAPPAPPPPPAPRTPEPPRSQVPAPRPEVPKATPIPEAPKPATRIAGIVVERAQGVTSLAAGTELPSGAGLEVAAGSAALRYPDGTLLELSAGTTLTAVQDRAGKGRGKRATVGKGVVAAEVQKQPALEPMVLVTPHGEVRVLGTSLRVTVEPAQTLVEVREGKVRVIRSRDGRSSEVGAGQAAIVAPDLDPRPVSAEEIVLLPAQARIVGPEWKLVADRRASSGVALEAGPTAHKVAEHVRKRPSYAAFTFYAQAGRDYRVWVRAASQATGDPWTRDLLTVDPWHAGASQKCPFFGSSDQTCFVFSGLAAAPAFHWVSGQQEWKEPLTVRFAATGLQTLRLYVAHPSVRVDAVWLSATQSARPPARQFPPSDSK